LKFEISNPFEDSPAPFDIALFCKKLKSCWFRNLKLLLICKNSEMATVAHLNLKSQI